MTISRDSLKEGIMKAHLNTINQYQDDVERRIVLFCRGKGMPQNVGVGMAKAISRDLARMLESLTTQEASKIIDAAL